MKKFISILLVFCLSGCTVLDFVAEDTQKQPDYLYNYDYKETNTTTKDQTTKDGFTVKNSGNNSNKNQTKKGFELVDNSKKELQSLYLFYLGVLKTRLAGKADMGEVNKVLKAALTA